MKVVDIMNRQPVTVTPDTFMRDFAQLMLRYHLNDVLVVDDDQRLIGIVTYEDVFRMLLPDYSEVTEDATRWTAPEAIEDRLLAVARMPAREFMSSNIHTVSPQTSAIHAGSIMNVRKIKQLPVVESGRLVGVVSYTDITWGLLTRYYIGAFYRRK
ncbi:MAG: CBS domain-containing protein [Candidatus Latescibacterota bacterium]|nr:MAG: CBS domain-containing protein [Candidatus Latescibacterota bacterium]